MLVDNAQIAVTVLSGAKTAKAGVGPASQSTASGPAAVLDLATGKGGVPAPGYGKADDLFGVKLQQSLMDREIKNRVETEEARSQLEGAFNRQDAGEKVGAGDIIAPTLMLQGLLEEKGLLSAAVEKRLNALANQATQELNLQSLQAIADVLEEQGVSAESIDEITSKVKEAISEQAEAQQSESAGAETAENTNS